MWLVLLSVWFKCFIISWVVSAIYLDISDSDMPKQFLTDYGIVRGILYYIFISALLGFGLSLLIFIGLFIAAITGAFFSFIF